LPDFRRVGVYLPRVSAFVLIAAAIVRKNAEDVGDD
jgi:hypothetical protein